MDTTILQSFFCLFGLIIGTHILAFIFLKLFSTKV